MEKNNIEQLYQKLGYQFKQKSLLLLALTHRSYSPENNERLEFLGDAVLNFFITKKLFREKPDHNEGELSRLRANLVNGDILASLARTLGINEYMRLGLGELKSGGLQRNSTLADAMEAIIGAIYLDGGAQACKDCITAWYSEAFIVNSSRGLKKDPKTQLQEYLQANKMNLPVYTVLSVQEHEYTQTFNIECRVDGLMQVSIGQGSSRRRAEQDAAQKMLISLGISA